MIDPEENQNSNEDSISENLNKIKRDFENEISLSEYNAEIFFAIFINSLSIFIILSSLEIGLPILLSAFAGLSLSIFPSLKNFNKFLESNKSEYLFKGLFRIILSLFICWGALSEYWQIERLSMRSRDIFLSQIREYENANPKNIEIDWNLFQNIAIISGIAFIISRKLKK